MIGLEERPVHTPPELPRRPTVSIGRVITGALVLLVGIGWMVDLTTTAAVSWGLLVPAALMLVGMGCHVRIGTPGRRRIDFDRRAAHDRDGRSQGRFRSSAHGMGSAKSGKPPPSLLTCRVLYEHGMGDYLLDLGALTFVTDQTVSLNMGIGSARVVVPPNAQVIVHAETGIGKLTVFDEVVDGLGLSLDRTWVAPGPTIHINAELGDWRVGDRPMKNSGSFLTGAAFFVIGAAYLTDALGWICAAR